MAPAVVHCSRILIADGDMISRGGVREPLAEKRRSHDPSQGRLPVAHRSHHCHRCGACCSRHFDIRGMEHAMTKLRGVREALPPVSVGAGPASTWARDIAETAWSFLWRVRSARNAAPTLMEWDNDVPPFPILTGEVARAEA